MSKRDLESLRAKLKERHGQFLKAQGFSRRVKLALRARAIKRQIEVIENGITQKEEEKLAGPNPSQPPGAEEET